MSKDTERQVIAALKALGKADHALRGRRYKAAAKHYMSAFDWASGLPVSEPFDRRDFTASCSAGLVLACARLGEREACLDLVDPVIEFIDEGGAMYPVEYGRWILAILAKGIALAEFGRRSDAEPLLRRAQKMFDATPSQRKEDVADQHHPSLHWEELIRENIQVLMQLLGSEHVRHTSRWKFWQR
jgi:hypothetical protein